VIRETLSNLEGRLDPSVFIRIHRRLIVNVDRIHELQPWFGGDQIVILKDGARLRLSRTFREKVAEKLFVTP
jgi:two-component system LytT family response regulator